MSEFRVGLRYGKALLGLAKEQGNLEEVKKDMDLLMETCKQSREFVNMLKSPIIKEDIKRNILHKIFKDKVSGISLKFFDIIIRKNRAGYLPAIGDSFLSQYYELKEIDRVTVTTTFPLDEELREKFREILRNTTGHEIMLREKIDKSLIGGYIVRLGDKQVDDSVKSKIRRIAYSFSDKNL